MSRRYDNQSESAADRQFFDLRETGYTGPIDEHGRPAQSEVLAQLRRDDPTQR